MQQDPISCCILSKIQVHSIPLINSFSLQLLVRYLVTLTRKTTSLHSLLHKAVSHSKGWANLFLSGIHVTSIPLSPLRCEPDFSLLSNPHQNNQSKAQVSAPSCLCTAHLSAHALPHPHSRNMPSSTSTQRVLSKGSSHWVLTPHLTPLEDSQSLMLNFVMAWAMFQAQEVHGFCQIPTVPVSHSRSKRSGVPFPVFSRWSHGT